MGRSNSSNLNTRFTGDDSHFQRVANRVSRTGRQMEAVGRRINRAFFFLGGGAALRGILSKFDRVGKVAKRLDTTAESVQRLAHVAEQSGSSLEQLQGILTRMERRTGEALNDGNSSAAKAFEELNINVEKFAKLDPESKLKRVADAFNDTGRSERGVASLMRLLDTEVRELIPLMQLGSEGITEMGNSISVLSSDGVSSIEKLNDSFTTFANNGLVQVADGLVKIFNLFGRVTEKPRAVSGTLHHQLMGVAVGAIDPDLSIYEGIVLGTETFVEKKVKERKEREKNTKAVMEEVDAVESLIKTAEKVASTERMTGRFRKFEAPGGLGSRNRVSAAARRSAAETAAFFDDSAPFGSGGGGGSRISVSPAANSSAQETRRFFNDARQRGARLEARVDSIAKVVESWESAN